MESEEGGGIDDKEGSLEGRKRYKRGVIREPQFSIFYLVELSIGGHRDNQLGISKRLFQESGIPLRLEERT